LEFAAVLAIAAALRRSHGGSMITMRRRRLKADTVKSVPGEAKPLRGREFRPKREEPRISYGPPGTATVCIIAILRAAPPKAAKRAAECLSAGDPLLYRPLFF
jgi:hypothetical protein